MSQAQPSEASPEGPEEESFDQAMRRDLDRRIDTLASGSGASFGLLGPGDWIATILLFVVAPLLLVWVYR
jgi:hypothetical protein